MNETPDTATVRTPADPTMAVRYPIPVVVVAGPDRGGPVLAGGRVYLSVPRPGDWLNKVVGVASVSEQAGAAGTLVASPMVASLETPSALTAQLQGRGADQAGLPPQLEQVGEDGKRIFASVQRQATANADRRRMAALLTACLVYRQRRQHTAVAPALPARPVLGL